MTRSSSTRSDRIAVTSVSVSLVAAILTIVAVEADLLPSQREQGPPDRELVEVPVAPRPAAEPSRPDREAIIARRNRPEVVCATKLVTPLSAIRYTLAREGSDTARALADGLTAALGEIRTLRLDPDATSWAATRAATDAAIADVASSAFASDETIARALDRYRLLVEEYEQLRADARG